MVPDGLREFVWTPYLLYSVGIDREDHGGKLIRVKRVNYRIVDGQPEGPTVIQDDDAGDVANHYGLRSTGPWDEVSGDYIFGVHDD